MKIKKNILIILLLISLSVVGQDRYPYNGPDYEYAEKDPYMSDVVKNNPYTDKKITSPKVYNYKGTESISDMNISMKYEISDVDFKIKGTIIINRITYKIVGICLDKDNYIAAVYLDPNRAAVAEVQWSSNGANGIMGYVREDENGEFDNPFLMKRVKLVQKKNKKTKK